MFTKKTLSFLPFWVWPMFFHRGNGIREIVLNPQHFFMLYNDFSNSLATDWFSKILGSIEFCRYFLTFDTCVICNVMCLLCIRITLSFIAVKMYKTKYIQNLMLNNILYYYFSERTCWKKLSKLLIYKTFGWLGFLPTDWHHSQPHVNDLFWLARQLPKPLKLLNLKLNNFFQQVLLEKW